MAPSSRKKSKPNSSELDAERALFLELHPDHDEPARLFDELYKVAGLEKVRKHNNELARIFRLSERTVKEQRKIAGNWEELTSGELGALPLLQKKLGLTVGADGVHTLISCAYFIRFPDQTSELSNQQMLAAIKTSTTPEEEILKDTETIEWSTAIVQKGFESDYRGHDLIVLPTLKTLREFAGLWKPDDYKAPYTSIIGPTMSGKTRLLKELAAHVCVVYVCLRPFNSSGQPPRSGIADYFTSPPPNSDLHEHYTRLLTAIFNTVSQFFSRDHIRKIKKFEDRLKAWFDYSFQLDGNVKDKYNNDVAEAMDKGNLRNRLRKGAEKLDQALAAAVTRVSNKLEFKNDGGLRVLLAIDEASKLIEPIDTKHEIPYFRVFRRALSQIPDSLGFFGVFTDTTSRVANFNPAPGRDPSVRFHGFGDKLFAPIYQIASLDVLVSKIPPSSWDELLLPKRLFNYGCPFYGLYFDGINEEKPVTAVRTTALIAHTKLLMKSPSASLELSEPQCFAILGSLIQTRLTLHSPINSELVASHAAHCLFIDETRELIVSEYPPQFVYASAANGILATNEKRWIKCIDVLASAVQRGLVALGDAGEMATRLILIYAMQKTPADPCNPTNTIPNGYSVRLADFLETLSGKDPDTMEFGCFNNDDANNNNAINKSEDNIRRLLKKGQIFFNHFARISYTPNDTDFLELLYRGLAVQCKSGQPGLDDLFPIYLAPTPESQELDSENITFCGVQTKNQTGYVDWKQSPNWSKSYATIKGIKNPYLILLFSLRTADCKVTKWENPTNPEDTGRVSYQFLGLDEIKCLTPEIRSALERLITAIPDDLLKLHDKPNESTEQWVKHVNHVFYPRAPEQPAPPST
ncbi:hypothetical protein PTTG_29143 [Puccinia triticina 1-1 BBBD Race 1]|uniref:Uncharacterized protein n=1 Tax=Puccinia triticina (isolate 1-1 / race 1 (BBBD)) TaxID=630390 RepID=A0A180G679_PUCT1|nr:hypothetical protein PTTG_29143 [Puccinia triticina 1-1 BBBD Race 1]